MKFSYYPFPLNSIQLKKLFWDSIEGTVRTGFHPGVCDAPPGAKFSKEIA